MPPEITDYYTVSVLDPRTLQERVNILIKAGWQPIRGMSMVHNPKTVATYFGQALVKYKQIQHKELT